MDIHEEKRELEREEYKRQLDKEYFKVIKLTIFGTLGVFTVYFGLIIWLISQVR